MKVWTEWEIIRHRVAIGGRIADEGKRPVGGVRVTLRAGPVRRHEQERGTAGAAKDLLNIPAQCPVRACSRTDGLYFFLDLPEGQYTVRALDPRSGRCDERDVSIPKKQNRMIEVVQVDFQLSA